MLNAFAYEYTQGMNLQFTFPTRRPGEYRLQPFLLAGETNCGYLLLRPFGYAQGKLSFAQGYG